MDTIDAEQFENYRPLMFSIAYRMLGSITEAEDIVQEAYLRYQAASPERIVSHKAFLSTVVTRLCLNQLELAKVQREAYIGPWLPEPALTEIDQRFLPAQQAELHESLSMAFLVLLELLADDVELWTDGGGKARGANTRPLRGRDAVSRFLLASTRFRTAGVQSAVVEVNGAPALMVHAGGKALVVLSLGIDAGQVHAIWVTGNPDKLQSFNRVLHASVEKKE